MYVFEFQMIYPFSFCIAKLVTDEVNIIQYF